MKWLDNVATLNSMFVHGCSQWLWPPRLRWLNARTFRLCRWIWAASQPRWQKLRMHLWLGWICEPQPKTAKIYTFIPINIWLSYQGLLQSFKGASVQHFLLDLGWIRAPGHQEQLLLLGHLCGSLQCPCLNITHINVLLGRETYKFESNRIRL